MCLIIDYPVEKKTASCGKDFYWRHQKLTPWFFHCCTHRFLHMGGFCSKSHCSLRWRSILNSMYGYAKERPSLSWCLRRYIIPHNVWKKIWVTHSANWNYIGFQRSKFLRGRMRPESVDQSPVWVQNGALPVKPAAFSSAFQQKRNHWLTFLSEVEQSSSCWNGWL